MYNDNETNIDELSIIAEQALEALEDFEEVFDEELGILEYEKDLAQQDFESELAELELKEEANKQSLEIQLAERAFEEELAMEKSREAEEEREEELRKLRENLSERARKLEEIGQKAELDPLPEARVYAENIQKEPDHSLESSNNSPKLDWDGERMSADITIKIGNQQFHLGKMKFDYQLQEDGTFKAFIDKDDYETMQKLNNLEYKDKKIKVSKYVNKIEQELNQAVPSHLGLNQLDNLGVNKKSPEGIGIAKRLLDGENIRDIKESLNLEAIPKKALEKVPALALTPF